MAGEWNIPKCLLTMDKNKANLFQEHQSEI